MSGREYCSNNGNMRANCRICFLALVLRIARPFPELPCVSSMRYVAEAFRFCWRTVDVRGALGHKLRIRLVYDDLHSILALCQFPSSPIPFRILQLSVAPSALLFAPCGSSRCSAVRLQLHPANFPLHRLDPKPPPRIHALLTECREASARSDNTCTITDSSSILLVSYRDTSPPALISAVALFGRQQTT